ncbi:transcriptional regulator [Stenotrophomonas humi]|uniref:Transcriptional regulator n=1 Tax=Stenotrophomonas humi TaxID=405444 RepID=A0A0R0C6R1_9GAMM|nr:GyrI-like domain-containing protein [Stenotrophomonas humi]KRG61783.1 transcriptional regulator [Stenotrophomonas humi]
MQSRIIELPGFTVVGMEYLFREGDNGFGQLWERFIPRENEVTGKREPAVSYGVCAPHTDGWLQYVAGFEVDEDAVVPEGMVRIQVPAQRYAVFTHVGTAAQIGASFEAIMDHLLDQHGFQPCEGVDLERYDQRFDDPFDSASEMELYIPIR